VHLEVARFGASGLCPVWIITFGAAAQLPRPLPALEPCVAPTARHELAHIRRFEASSSAVRKRAFSLIDRDARKIACVARASYLPHNVSVL